MGSIWWNREPEKGKDLKKGLVDGKGGGVKKRLVDEKKKRS